MAAATVDSRHSRQPPVSIREIRLSSLTSDQAEDLAHGGSSGVAPLMVIPIVTAAATDGSQVTGEWIRASDVTASDTVRVKFKVPPGGDISGAKASVYILFVGQASGSLNP